ncbi:MAG: MBOAT family protein [Planctomycetota bacterium]
MLFHTLEFAWFLLAVLLLYRALPRRGQNLLLLGASYLFYASWSAQFLGLILASTLVDYCAARRIEAARGRGSDGGNRNARFWVLLSLTTNLGALGLFKYAGFFLTSLEELLAGFGIESAPLRLEFVLPVGISFYTFQTLSYTLDVYAGRIQARRDFADFALFVAFFPQLVAGPIERASKLLPQIENARERRLEDLGRGAALFFVGLFKKLVLADNLARLVDQEFAVGGASGGPLTLLAVYAFAFQILCDFSGYSDMARGVARMLGFELSQNFRMPYLATGPRDFWKRWHVTLSQWLRDYVYIPLGGNRGGRIVTYRNLLLTMLIGGLWHGAAWTFVAWGAWHGVILCIAHLSDRSSDEAQEPAFATRPLRIIAFFHVTCLGWILFRCESLSACWELITAIFSMDAWATAIDQALKLQLDPETTTALAWVSLIAVALTTADIARTRANADDAVSKLPRSLCLAVVCAIAVALPILGVAEQSEFLYFQF